jgi:hypothetical protein
MADARATLLEALDQIDRVSAEHEDDVVRVFVAVTYSVETTTASVDGLVKTDDPVWITLALLSRGYEALEAAIEAAQADDDD